VSMPRVARRGRLAAAGLVVAVGLALSLPVGGVSGRGLAAGSTAATGTLAAGVTAAGVAPRANVADRKTVLVTTTASGAVEPSNTWIFDQLVVTGHGTYRIVDPSATHALRNLDGFSAPVVRGGDAIWTVTARGEAQRRTVAPFRGSLPLTVHVGYTLNGRPIAPSRLLGRSGTVGVTYTVRNVTGRPEVIGYKNGSGHLVHKTVDIVTPFVGQLTTDLPGEWTAVDSPRASVAADGHGGNQLTWTMVLFSPIGQTTQRFGYRADARQISAVPASTVQAVPVPPDRKPELKFGQTGFLSGATTGQQLTSGAAKIDSGVLKLAAGAGQLLHGLVQLDNGAVQLHAGLSGQALPGSRRLATGSQQLVGGLRRVAGGLGQLASSSSGLPAARTGIADLQAGVSKLVAAVGNPAAPASNTLLFGLHGIANGLAEFVNKNSASSLYAAVHGLQLVRCALAGTAPCSLLTNVSALADQASKAEEDLGLQLPKIGTAERHLCQTRSAACTALAAALTKANDDEQQLSVVPFINLIIDTGAKGTPSLVAGLTDLIAGTQKAIAGIGTPSTGSAAHPTLRWATAQLEAGVGTASTPNTLLWGLNRVGAGLGQLAAGITRAVNGVFALYNGVSGKALPGAEQIAAGNGQLAAGLSTAATGSGELASGLGRARAGTPALVNGLRQVHVKGTAMLVRKGNAAALSYGEQYAIMQALNARAANGPLPYGAPAGAVASAAYVYTITGVTPSGWNNAIRIAIAAGLLVFAAAAGLLIRRRRLLHR
jgi:putative membrane protein